MDISSFPARYEPMQRLGKGGGGEVWQARDRISGDVVALKLLPDDADEATMLALVREATLLSGIEGLGVPRVLHFGRLPGSERAFMVRELVEGRSLAELVDDGVSAERGLAAVAQAADRVTQLHRALLLHGDIKPANIIVAPDGTATLVDLGLAAPWQEGGSKPEGLTPRFAAPELFYGQPLTVRAEVFALGASAQEVLASRGAALGAPVRAAVDAVILRATAQRPEDRFPSADEFGEALRRAAGLDVAHVGEGAQVWTIEGIEPTSQALVDRIGALAPGDGLVVTGAHGSGRTTLLRRVAWSLGVAGAAVLFVERQARDAGEAVDVMADRDPRELVVIVDDADKRSDAELARLDALREAGAVLILAATPRGAPRLPGRTFGIFDLPPLEAATGAALVRRMIPSLGDKLVRYLVARAGGLPGLMRAIVAQLDGQPVVSIEDVERRLGEVPVPKGVRIEPEEIHRLLDRGLFDQAADYLAAYEGEASVTIGLARAKLATGRGDPGAALRELRGLEHRLDEEGHEAPMWHTEKARAHLRTGDYEDAERHAGMALTRLGASLLGEVAQGRLPDDGASAPLGPMVAEALAVSGLAQSLSGRHDQATRTLERSVDVARGVGDPRVLALTLGSLAFALQRNDALDAAQAANLEALELAERAGDAGHVATTRLNLAGIARMRGDVASAITHLEAAVDMGRRSGRQSTVRQALLNLANLNLYLGRLARAQGSIDALAAERASLGAVQQAQLLALEAEGAALAGDYAAAEERCLACAAAYETLRRPVDAAEALLERVLFALRAGTAAASTTSSGAGAPVSERPVDLGALQEEIFRAEALLADAEAHRALFLQARGKLALAARELGQAESSFDEAIAVAERLGQREWLWRAHAARAELFQVRGDLAAATRDQQRATELLGAIAAELPPDLREVYWGDPRRRALRPASARSSTSPVSVTPVSVAPVDAGDVNAPTQIGALREDRLARILEINRALAGEHDLDRLLEKVTDHAIALLYAERGFVLLKSDRGAHLSVHAARDRRGDDQHARFSRSIAERVVDTGDPFVAVDALRDERVSDYVSVHSLMLKSVACVPIRSRGGVIGALYLETRLRSGSLFGDELPTLSAFADQVAIAIESARLLAENRQRAEELEQANHELAAARDKLEELLGRRTEQLAHTKRDLRSARAVIRGHFGYQGIVGTATSMRRVYAIIDRVKETDVPVLITGESGTGKEVIARAIHKASPRAKNKLVGVNCGAIPEQLLESELFGHVRGAFTGADRDKKGLFRELDGGTILLDEIGEMPQKMQAGLLRVLQEKVVRPVGGSREEPVNTRVIAATHRNLAEMVRTGAFREDLFYRLNVIELRVPALRERIEDVPLLIDHFLRLFAARYGRDRRNVSREALKLLMAHPWPGNVRQLENVLLNAWILSDAPELGPEDFELPTDDRAPTSESASVSEVRARPQTATAAKAQEKDRILEALEESGWNRAQAAKLIGMPRRTFYRRLKKYGIQ